MNRTANGNLTGRLLHNLTVTVTHAQLTSRYPGWNRTNETPSFNRLYYIDSGEGKVIINGVAYYPRPGQLMIMPAGSTQTTDTSRADPYTRYYCHFDAQIGEWPLFHSANKLYICDVPDPEAARTMFAEMIEWFQDTGFLATLRTQAALLTLLSLCLESGGYSNFLDDLTHTSDQGKLASVLGYIDQRLMRPLTVEELAELVHLHPNYFIPYFKEIHRRSADAVRPAEANGAGQETALLHRLQHLQYRRAGRHGAGPLLQGVQEVDRRIPVCLPEQYEVEYNGSFQPKISTPL